MFPEEAGIHIGFITGVNAPSQSCHIAFIAAEEDKLCEKISKLLPPICHPPKLGFPISIKLVFRLSLC